MSWATLTPTMRQALLDVSTGARVYDFGAGDCELANLVADVAASVTAIDDQNTCESQRDPRVLFIYDTFRDAAEFLPPACDVAIVSWPTNNARTMLELLPWLQHATRIVYIGSNFDGTECGSPALYGYFATRELLWHESHVLNSMLILGAPAVARRDLTREEAAGIDADTVHLY
jgi:hypothetical protein